MDNQPAPTVQMRLIKTYVHQGVFYGPGLVEVPAALAAHIGAPSHDTVENEAQEQVDDDSAPSQPRRRTRKPVS
jgi:hypothetical protein